MGEGQEIVIIERKCILSSKRILLEQRRLYPQIFSQPFQKRIKKNIVLILLEIEIARLNHPGFRLNKEKITS